MRINLTSVLVDDQEKALRFYTDVLGFKKKRDMPLGEHRWLTVTSAEDPRGPELGDRNAIFVPDDPGAAARAIAAGLDDYGRFVVDRDRARRVFGASHNLSELRAWLSGHLERRGLPVDGSWYLDDLHVRLAGHGQKYDAQFMRSEQTFFAWLDAVERFDPYDEDAVLGSIGAEGAVTGWRDPPDPLLRRAARRLTDRFGQALTRFAR